MVSWHSWSAGLGHSSPTLSYWPYRKWYVTTGSVCYHTCQLVECVFYIVYYPCRQLFMSYYYSSYQVHVVDFNYGVGFVSDWYSLCKNQWTYHANLISSARNYTFIHYQNQPPAQNQLEEFCLNLICTMNLILVYNLIDSWWHVLFLVAHTWEIW